MGGPSPRVLSSRWRKKGAIPSAGIETLERGGEVIRRSDSAFPATDVTLVRSPTSPRSALNQPTAAITRVAAVDFIVRRASVVDTRGSVRHRHPRRQLLAIELGAYNLTGLVLAETGRIPVSAAVEAGQPGRALNQGQRDFLLGATAMEP